MRKFVYFILAVGLLVAAVSAGGAVRPSAQRPEYSPFEPDSTIVVAAGIFGLEEFFTGEVEASRDTAWDMINFARNYIGCRYVYATHGPTTFDCSGFTGFVYSHYGINLSYSSRYQSTQGRPVAPGLENLQTADLVFFGSRRNPAVLGHVGMVVETFPEEGYFTFIHAALSGVEIQRSDMSYYKIRYLFARRILLDFDADTCFFPQND